MGYVVVPHDYVNYWRTGEIVMEAGEASGTGFFDVASRAWSPKMVEAIDPSGILARALPPIVSPREPIGTIRKIVAEEFGLSPHTLVACGSGDNVMGAVGTASVSPGRVTMGLGTSGVINLHSNSFLRTRVGGPRCSWPLGKGGVRRPAPRIARH